MPEPATILTVGYADFFDLGITAREVDFWTRCGYLHAIDPQPGSGNRRRWPETELAVARTIQRLRRAGLDLHVAHEVARGRVEIATGVWVLIDREVSDR